MKTMIISSALYFLWLIFAMFQIDNNKFILHQEDLKYQVDELAQIGAMQTNDVDLSEGYITYNYDEANREILNLLKLNLDLDGNLKTIEDSFWNNDFEYYSYFFDEKGKAKVYRNGVLQNEFLYSYGYTFKEDLNGFEYKIISPSVVVTLNAGTPNITSDFVKVSDVVRTGVYEYYERK